MAEDSTGNVQENADLCGSESEGVSVQNDVKLCGKCGKVEVTKHTDAVCTYNMFITNMKSKDYISVSSHDDLDEILSMDEVPREQFKWMLSTSLVQGYIHFIYVPRWVMNAVNMYHENGNFAGFTLTEFLHKMNPA